MTGSLWIIRKTVFGFYKEGVGEKEEFYAEQVGKFA